jgi:hypothetical protein
MQSIEYPVVRKKRGGERRERNELKEKDKKQEKRKECDDKEAGKG